jgi:hypothetical protein
MSPSVYRQVSDDLVRTLPNVSDEALAATKTNISSHMYWTVYTKLMVKFNSSFYMPVVNKMTNSLNNAFGGGRISR